MSKKGNKYKIGALALVAIAILVFGLLSLGIMKYFQPEVFFMTATDSSVQGLKIGSNVKIKGVTIGSVKNIKIGLKGEIIYIVMQLDLSTLLDQTEEKIEFQSMEVQRVFEGKIKDFIDKGLRCQMQYEGITGDMYVNLAYFDLKEYPISIPKLPKKHYVFIPMVPTPTIGNILQTAQNIAKKLNEVDIKLISDNFDNLITSINDLISQMRAVTNERRINELSDNLSYSLNKFNQTMSSLNTLIRTIQSQPDSIIWGKSGSKVVPSLESFTQP